MADLDVRVTLTADATVFMARLERLCRDVILAALVEGPRTAHELGFEQGREHRLRAMAADGEIVLDGLTARLP